ncbi:hypothetical protein L9F63_014876, partial [Diploptera punctata]
IIATIFSIEKMRRECKINFTEDDISAVDHHVARNLTEAYELVVIYNRNGRESQKKYFDKGKVKRDFAVGDWIYLQNVKVGGLGSKKLSAKFKGPYKVVNKISDCNYAIDNPLLQLNPHPVNDVPTPRERGLAKAAQMNNPETEIKLDKGFVFLYETALYYPRIAQPIDAKANRNPNPKSLFTDPGGSTTHYRPPPLCSYLFPSAENNNTCNDINHKQHHQANAPLLDPIQNYPLAQIGNAGTGRSSTTWVRLHHVK